MTQSQFYIEPSESPYIGVPSGLDEYHRRVAKMLVTRALSDARWEPEAKANNIVRNLERALLALEVLG